MDQKSEPLGRVYDFAVDENELIYVPDSAFSNVKVFDSSGKGIKTIGRKGGGPSEIIDPVRNSLDKERILIEDVGLLKYIVFDREFRELKRIFYLLSGQPFVYKGDKIIANEFFRKTDSQGFRGIILDLNGNVVKGLIEQGNAGDAWDAIKDAMGYIDVSPGGDIFLAKSGGVNIFKFDGEGNLLKRFGVQPKYFISAQRTREFDEMVKWGRASQGREAGQKWYRSSSWVTGVFVLKEKLGIPIRTFSIEENKWECYLQIYDFDGNLLEDGLKLPELGSSSNRGFSVRSDHDQNVYFLEEVESDPPQYQFYHYRITK